MRLNRSIVIAAIVTAASSIGTAFAQTSAQNRSSSAPDTQVPAPAYPGPSADVVPPPVHTRWTPSTGVGVGLMAGGGLTDFTSGPTRGQTSTGGAWTARLVFRTRRILGFEGSYIGGENSLNGLGFGNATLVRSGVEGALRINAPLQLSDSLVEPYVLAGLGWNGYHVNNYSSTAHASIATGTDNTLSVPLGAGLAFGYHGFLADLRYTVRPTYGQEIFQNETSSALSNWDLGGMLGYEF